MDLFRDRNPGFCPDRVTSELHEELFAAIHLTVATSTAAVVVGGTALVGGRGSFLGTIAGVLVLTEINTLLIGLNFSPASVQAAFGAIILLLVSLYGRERHFRTTV